MAEKFFNALEQISVLEATIWATIENLVIFGVCMLVGHILVRQYDDFLITHAPEPISRLEIIFATSCVTLNILVTVIGIIMWQINIIRVDFGMNPLRIGLDTILLIFAMYLAMYFFHRIAHHPRLYPLIHRTHHRFENPRPLTLFVLNPFETLCFGTLWLLVITLYPANWLGIIIYLALNIVFGLVGHIGVESMLDSWVNSPIMRYISTSTFHAEHHFADQRNFGFYTLIWDRLFGAISPDYLQDFSAARQGIPYQVGD